jgi:outer membrane receptor for ferrienterochelin and colicins
MIVIAMTAAALMSGSPVADSSHVPDTVTTGTVVVTEQAPEISRSPIKIENIRATDLQKSACCSLAESFEKSPTVEVTFADAASGARHLQLLGIRGTYAPLLIDAVPLNRGIGMAYALDHLPGPFLDQISISKGASTVVAGHDDISGQINACVLQPLTLPQLYLNAYGNTMGRFELNSFGRVGISEDLALGSFFHARTMQLPTDANADGFTDIPLFQQFNVMQKLSYVTDDFEHHAFLRVVNDSYQAGTIIEEHGHHGISAFSINTDIQRYDGYAKVGWKNVYPWALESSVAVVLSGVWLQQQTEFPARQITGLQRSARVQTITSADFEQGKLIAGVVGSYDNIGQELDSSVQIRYERELGAFAEWNMTPVENLQMIVGARIDANNLFGTRVVPRMHVKYEHNERLHIRASIGRGWRTPNMIIENIGALMNYRTAQFPNELLPEDAWNTGASVTWYLFGEESSIIIDAEIFHTWFARQLVVDFDRSARTLAFENILGQSRSTQTMVQVRYSPLASLDLMAAYRHADVVSVYNSIRQLPPMFSPQRFLLTASLHTDDNSWQVDATVLYSSAGRIPTTAENIPTNIRATQFDGYWRANMQLTYRAPWFDVYAGMENITNVLQPDPVISSTNPFAQEFDASLTWGPLDTRTLYFGVRYTL